MGGQGLSRRMAAYFIDSPHLVSLECHIGSVKFSRDVGRKNAPLKAGPTGSRSLTFYLRGLQFFSGEELRFVPTSIY